MSVEIYFLRALSNDVALNLRGLSQCKIALQMVIDARHKRFGLFVATTLGFVVVLFGAGLGTVKFWFCRCMQPKQ